MSAALADGPFHAGELRAQALAGFGAPGTAIRDFMPEQHRSFFAMLRFLLLATTDADDWPHATVLTGPEGFVGSPDPRRLRICAAPDPRDPTRALLRPDAAVGLLGIDFRTRRRNRANGILATTEGDVLEVAVKQSFGNCPKYIQVHELQDAETTGESAPTIAFGGLDREAREQVAAAATFFVATSSGQEAGGRGGIDISHRGGTPGFIDVSGNTLTIPDFSGNRYFNTLGNLLLEPRAALLFIDFAGGTLLHLQGRAEIDWNGANAAARFPGAERLWRFEVARGWRRRNALPLR